MESLLRVVDYDVCMALLFDQYMANVTSKTAKPVMNKLLSRIQDHLVEDVSRETGENIRKKRLGTFYIPPPEYVDTAKGVSAEISEVRSSFNTPFIVRGKTIGAMNLSSHKEKAFSAEDIKLVHTLANLVSNAIERLQTVITAEKSKMERMVESMLEGVIMTDEAGEVVVINPRGKLMLGIKGEEAISTELVTKKLKQAELYESYMKAKEEEKLVTKEINALYDPERFLSCDMFPVKDPEGDVVGTVIVLRDITREKEVDRMKTDFVATVSHELRTPLTTVREATSQVLDGVLGDTTDWQKEILRISLADIDRLKRIINSLLDISKIEAGKIHLQFELVDVVNIAKEVGISFAPQIGSKGLELKEKFSSGRIKAYVDKDRINQVFTNLVGNAVKFTNKGSIEIGIVEHEDKIECYVADTGVGISKEDIPLVFTKFRQFGRKFGPGEKGTGLGLSISRGIVELHNGRIWAESEQGKGSKFTFVLPKYNKYEILCNNIERRIADARKERKELTILIFRLDNYAEIENSLGKDKAEEIFLKMSSALRRDTRAGEYLESDKNNEIVLVVEGSRESAFKISGRLKGTVIKTISDIGEEARVKLVYGCASYPEDGNSANDLIKEAKICAA
jgi:diguanylate cyclase (GGDEF)-like protein/PAS domain S-box-containing protein